MQVGVSLVDPGNTRSIVRGGGADTRDSIADWHANENCSEVCYYGMMFGGLGDNWYNLPLYGGYNNPHYLKCTEAAAAAPLNGLRLQLASQFSTLSLDPTVPQMNVTDSNACLRMSFELFYAYLHENYWEPDKRPRDNYLCDRRPQI